VEGWAFYLHEDVTLHIGGLVAASPAATAALVDAALGLAGTVDAAACFIRDRAPGLVDALARRGFEVERYFYLARVLTPDDAAVPEPGGDGPALDRFRPGDARAAGDLLQDAYALEQGRHFAAHGTAAEWRHYVDTIVAQRGCGVFDPLATRVLRDAEGLRGAALVTAIAPRTAHLAQLAVRPDCRGRGLAARLLDQAMASAARAGKSAMTLIVGERNAAARALYASRGFVERGLFVGARRELRAAAGEPELASLLAAHRPEVPAESALQ
jgi:ribosomal protein S18 acetylase RimI-like enzyme